MPGHYTFPSALGYRARVDTELPPSPPPLTLVTCATGFVGSAVARAGTPGLAILLAATTAWARDGHALRLLDPSPALREAAAALALPLADLGAEAAP